MRGFTRIITVVGAVGLLFAAPSAVATDYTSTNFMVKDPVLTIGGGLATSSGFQLWSAIGEPAIGISNAASYVLKGGFLYFPAPTAATTTSPTPAASFPVIYGPSATSAYPLRPMSSICDFNRSGVCNITDLSILLYYYGRSGIAVARYDLNKNGTVDFPDISILFYYWNIV